MPDPIGARDVCCNGHSYQRHARAPVANMRVRRQWVSHPPAVHTQLVPLGRTNEKMRRTMWLDAASRQHGREASEVSCGPFRDLIERLLRFEHVRVVKERPQDSEMLRLRHLVICEPIDPLRRIGEVRVDLEGIHVADNQQGRVIEVVTVLEQLLVGICEARVAALVLPGEVPLEPDISESLTTTSLLDTALKGEECAIGVRLGRCGMPEHPAQIQEVLLGGCAFLEIHIVPLGGEFLWSHRRRFLTRPPSGGRFGGMRWRSHGTSGSERGQHRRPPIQPDRDRPCRGRPFGAASPLRVCRWVMSYTPSRHTVGEWYSAPTAARRLARRQTTPLRCDPAPIGYTATSGLSLRKWANTACFIPCTCSRRSASFGSSASSCCVIHPSA